MRFGNEPCPSVIFSYKLDLWLVQVENQTGLELVCRFDHGKAKQDGVVQSWETNAFLIRYITGWGRSHESTRTYLYEV